MAETFEDEPGFKVITPAEPIAAVAGVAMAAAGQFIYNDHRYDVIRAFDHKLDKLDQRLDADQAAEDAALDKPQTDQSAAEFEKANEQFSHDLTRYQALSAQRPDYKPTSIPEIAAIDLGSAAAMMLACIGARFWHHRHQKQKLAAASQSKRPDLHIVK